MKDTIDEQLTSLKTDFIEAGKRKRLVNFLIDYLLVYVYFGIVGSFTGVSDGHEVSFFVAITFLFVPMIYFLLSEVFYGKTVGKIVTKTRVVGVEGSKLGLKKVLIRTLVRIIPFEPFSFLGSNKGWHDRVSGTYVVEDETRFYPKNQEKE